MQAVSQIILNRQLWICDIVFDTFIKLSLIIVH